MQVGESASCGFGGGHGAGASKALFPS
jgi:hypothetical protein